MNKSTVTCYFHHYVTLIIVDVVTILECTTFRHGDDDHISHICRVLVSIESWSQVRVGSFHHHDNFSVFIVVGDHLASVSMTKFLSISFAPCVEVIKFSFTNTHSKHGRSVNFEIIILFSDLSDQCLR